MRLPSLLLLLIVCACSSSESTDAPAGGGAAGASSGGSAGASGSAGTAGSGGGVGGSAGVGGSGGAAGAGSAVPVIHPDDPHRLAWHGTSFYPVGYYIGTAVNMTGADYAGDSVAFMKEYMDKASGHGINLFRVWLNWGNVNAADTKSWDAYILHPYQRTGPGTAFDGKPRVDVTQFNPEYFTRLETIVDYAAAKGMVVQAMLLDCWHVGFGLNQGFKERDYFTAQNNVNGISWSTEAEWLDPKGPVFEKNELFIRKVVQTIGDRENLIWETCNEKKQGDHSTAAATKNDPFHAAVASVVHDEEDAQGFPRHLVMPVDLPEHRTVAGHRTPTNGAANEETVAQMHQRLVDTQYAWNVPLISDNDCCNGEPDAQVIRRKTWAALTGGGHVDVFNNDAYVKSVLSNANTSNGMKWVGLSAKLVADRGIELSTMAPHDELADGGAWVLANPGQEYLVVLPSGGKTTLSGAPASVDAKWFDPRTGALSDAGAGPSFTAPDGKDWVLHVRAQ